MAVVDGIIDVAPEVVLELGRLGKWVQAVGLIVIAWIIIEAITLYYNWKRRRLLESIKRRLEAIENKVDKLGKKKK